MWPLQMAENKWVTGVIIPIPDTPCMDYLPTLGKKWPHSRGNVGKYSLHGASGYTYSCHKNSSYIWFLDPMLVVILMLIQIH